jgi:hypothetical protein
LRPIPPAVSSVLSGCPLPYRTVAWKRRETGRSPQVPRPRGEEEEEDRPEEGREARMESRNVVVCDNGTGVSPHLPDPPHLRSIPRSAARSCSGSRPSFSRTAPDTIRRCFGHWLGGSRFESRSPVPGRAGPECLARLDGGWEPWRTEKSETRLFVGASVAVVRQLRGVRACLLGWKAMTQSTVRCRNRELLFTNNGVLGCFDIVHKTKLRLTPSTCKLYSKLLVKSLVVVLTVCLC